MPITTEEKSVLDTALAAIEPIDHVAITRLLYATLLDAKLGPHNPNGMGWKAISSLARMAQEKTPWDSFRQIEASIEAPIRLPLIKSCDTIFRGNLANDLTKLSEENKQTIAFALGKMDDVELVALTKILYEIFALTEFPSADAQAAFGKFYWSGYSWADMQNSPDVLKNVLLPIANACAQNFATLFSGLFQVEAPPVDLTAQAEGEASAADPNTPVEQADATVATETSTDDELAAAIAEMEKEMQATSVDPTAVDTKSGTAEPSPLTGLESEDEGPSGDPNAPMPLPEFGTPEEVEARAKADEEKPKFKAGKKKKKLKNGHAETPAAETSSEAESAESAEPSESTESTDSTESADDAPESDANTAEAESDPNNFTVKAKNVEINDAGETVAHIDAVSAYPTSVIEKAEKTEEPTQ